VRTMNALLDFLLGAVYEEMALHPEHLADLRKSGLADETIQLQKIRSVPPHMMDLLVGFRVPASVTSAYAIPYPDPTGGFMPHIRMKLFPPMTEEDGPTVKYLQPARSGVRLFFPLATIPAVVGSEAPLWLVEGEKKALAVAQRGLPTVGIAGINCWSAAAGSRRLHPDFDRVPLMGRVVELVPDSDWQTHRRVGAAVSALATALAGAGARPRVVVLPDEVSA
jgi:hypothetical protein